MISAAEHDAIAAGSTLRWHMKDVKDPTAIRRAAAWFLNLQIVSPMYEEQFLQGAGLKKVEGLMGAWSIEDDQP